MKPDEGFAMDWENYADKSKQLKAIADEAKKADRLILATDPDREGEAISWHIVEILRERGLRLLYDTPKRGTSNSRVNFIHPKDAGGILVELVEPSADAAH